MELGLRRGSFRYLACLHHSLSLSLPPIRLYMYTVRHKNIVWASCQSLPARSRSSWEILGWELLNGEPSDWDVMGDEDGDPRWDNTNVMKR